MALFEAVDERAWRCRRASGRRSWCSVRARFVWRRSAFLSLNNIIARHQRALFSGPTFNNTMWTT